MFLTQPRLAWASLKSILIILVLCAANGVMAAPPLLTVSGNQIVTNTGCATQLKGVDVDGLEFCSTGYGPPSGCGGSTLAVAQEAVGTWKASIIRLPLNQDSWFGCAGVNQANYQALVASIVNYCSSMNAYVILDLHWSGESSTATAPCGAGWGNDNNVAQQYMADQNAVTFWSSVAAAYANNPAVFFDLYNEPFSSNGNDDSTAWSVWAYGGTGNGASFSTPGMQALLNAVRGAGAQNICLIGGLGYASDLTQIQSYPFTNTGNGIVYSTHLYGNPSGGDSPSGWDSQVPAALRAASPVFVGEMGPYITCNGDNATYDSNIFAWVNGTAGIVGGTAWSLTTSSCPNLLTDWSWDRSSWGNAVFNWLASPYPVCPSGPTPTPVVASTWRVNAGGPAYTDSQGNVWAADENYSGGTAAVTTSTITGALPAAVDQTLYQSQRYGNPFSYSFNVPAGNYQITMKFAETYWTAAGQRVFNVSVNGTQVLTNFDIFATTGGQNRAIDEVFNNIAPSGGVITITFGPASVDNAVVQAIQIIPQPGTPTSSPTGTFTPTKTGTPTFTPTNTPTYTPITLSTWRVNAGGPQYTDTKGNVWAADENYTGGTAAVTTSAITGALPGAADQTLYQSQRYGNPFSYTFNVPAGTYQLTLKFAETYWTAAGQRIFNVSVNGTQVLTNFDIFTTTGGQNRAIDEVFNNIAPSGGVITISFGPASVDNAVVMAIQIIPQPATATATSTFSMTATNTFTSTNTGTATATALSTATLTYSFTPTGTSTSSPTATTTNTMSSTWTSTFSSTATHSNTPTSSPTGTSTFTSSYTPTKTYTSTPVNTSTPTATNTDSSTATASFTATSTASLTATNTLVGTLTPVPTNTPVNTSSPTGTSTLTDTSTLTMSPTATFTATATNTLSFTPTGTATSSPTATLTSTNTGTASPTNTGTMTATNTQAIPTSTKTCTFTPSATVTNTATSTQTATSTATNSFTATSTATPTLTYTFTLTKTASPTSSSTGTATWTYTSTYTPTAKIPTATNTFTPTPTFTFTAVPPTLSPTGTATATAASACSGIPAWNGNFVAYSAGQKVSYDGELYQCIQSHTSEPNWMPPVVPALWKDLGPCGTTPTPALAIAQPLVYPNPAISSTVTIQLPNNNATNVTVQIFTISLRLVQTIHVQQVLGNGLVIQLADKSGVRLSNGLYYFQIQADGQKWTNKVLVLR